MFGQLTTRPALSLSLFNQASRTAVLAPRLRHATTTTGGTQATSAQQPTSDSAQEGDVKSSRATDSTPQKDTKSVQTPVTNPSAGQGQDEEGDDPQKQNPNQPAGQKAEKVHQQGMKPMDAGNK